MEVLQRRLLLNNCYLHKIYYNEHGLAARIKVFCKK